MMYEYDDPFRPNYEFYSALTWAISVPIGYIVYAVYELPIHPFLILCVMAVFLGVSNLFAAWKLKKKKNNLKGQPLGFYSAKDLRRIMKKNKDAVWYGRGFDWKKRHSQVVFEVLRRDEDLVLKQHASHKGARWVHGIEDKKNYINIVQPEDNLGLHTLIVGTTGSGKTRIMETLITQAIFRGEGCIVIDPKGDMDMRDTMKKACELDGRPEAFGYFHPAFPYDSIRINPLASFNHSTEVASRISGIIEAGNNPTFRDFGFMAINNIVSGLLHNNEAPTLVKIKEKLVSNVDGLLIQALQTYCENIRPTFLNEINTYIAGTNNNLKMRAQGMIRYYRENIQTTHGNTDLEGLISMFEHDKAHFQKMITSTLPLLTMLSSGDMGYLLSPSEDEDEKVFSSADLINTGKAMYIGLDSLSNELVAQGLGQMILSDMASVCGNRYNFGVGNKPLNIFVDEAAECLSDKLIQILNKGRGSSARLTLGTQTYSDFEAKLKDAAKAKQVLSNLNNTIVLRTIEPNTQKEITDMFAKTRVSHLQKSHGNTTESNTVMGIGGNVSEQLIEEEYDLFPPQMLGRLPDLEYIASLAGGRIVKGRVEILGKNKSKQTRDKEKDDRYKELKKLGTDSFDTNKGFEPIPKSFLGGGFNVE